MVFWDQGGESLRIFKKIPKAPEAVGGWDLAMGSKHEIQIELGGRWGLGLGYGKQT